jgi:hypothetical protein
MLFPFLSGAITMGCATAGLFFLRFWKRTRDRLFIAFALAFWLLAIGQALLTFTRSRPRNAPGSISSASSPSR